MKTVLLDLWHFVRHGARLIDGTCMVCGHHKGPITRRYFGGNPAKMIHVRGQRFPESPTTAVEDMS